MRTRLMVSASAIKVSRPQLIKRIEENQVTLIPFNQVTENQAEDGQQSALFLQVRKIIARVLELDESAVTGEAHIFHDLGATSIQYFSILSALAEHFSVSNYESSDTYCYTAKEICEYLERKL